MIKYRKAYIKENLDAVPTFKYDKKYEQICRSKRSEDLHKNRKEICKDTYNLWMRRIPSFYSTKKGLPVTISLIILNES